MYLPVAESDSADRRPAYAVVADGLRDRILAGDLKPGTRLPVDADLRAEFGVGQSTVREAIRTLASENLVRTVRGATGGRSWPNRASGTSLRMWRPGSRCWRPRRRSPSISSWRSGS
ncbi:winged helix-turn-helix domain-containing protein [Gordonia humi]|uniref:winged helix-turn-helix domain-containing protein n=1 Tax=Gordonia humi TaxID=686429 RepID=UPI003622E519